MKFFSTKIGYFEVIVFLILTFLFYNFTFTIQTDIQLHAQFIKDYADGNKPFQVNFLYYFLVYSLTFFSSESPALLLMSVYVLTIATFFKYYLVKLTFLNITNKNSIQASVFASMLLFCFSIPFFYYVLDYFYLLNFPPNIWHNSTTIFVMPFVFSLFYISVNQLQQHKNSNLLLICILIIINAVSKPSFLFVYLIAYSLMLLMTYPILTKKFWINIAPLAIAMILIVIEYLFIYQSTEVSSNSSIEIDFFRFYNNWGKGYTNISLLVMAIISSLLFPMVVILKNKQFLKQKILQTALLFTTIAILISITLTETGLRENDGNFLWQSFMCVFLLYFSCIYLLLKEITKLGSSKKFFLEFTVFSIHFISGILYLINIFINKNYA